MFRRCPALLAIRKTTAFLDNRLRAASPPQDARFLNWNRSNLTGEKICHFSHAVALHWNQK